MNSNISNLLAKKYAVPTLCGAAVLASGFTAVYISRRISKKNEIVVPAEEVTMQDSFTIDPQDLEMLVPIEDLMEEEIDNTPESVNVFMSESDNYWDYEFTALYNLPHFIRPFEENLINKDKVFEKKFTFLNRVPKNHRIYLYEAFKKANILNDFYYSINAENNPEYPESITIEDTIVDYQTLIKLGKIDVYDKSFCSIITESEYYSGTFGYSYKSIFFTEKTIKPMT
jgi:hypothetical protein